MSGAPVQQPSADTTRYSSRRSNYLRQKSAGCAELTRMDLSRMAELVERYADLPPGAADASVVALAERLELREIATLDHRDFAVVRPRHIDAFRLLPE